ncbi:MAG TPA: hypothetical protein VJ860_14135, partial [Polyangia bacterium]|nr:hypothetical protein [Polyangia bacterium]
PSHDVAPQSTPATLKVAAPEVAAVAAVAPVRQEAPRDAGAAAPAVLPSKVESVAAAPVVTGGRPRPKLARAGGSSRRHAPAPKETFPQFQRPAAAPGGSYSPTPPHPSPSPARRQDDPAGF